MAVGLALEQRRAAAARARGRPPRCAASATAPGRCRRRPRTASRRPRARPAMSAPPVTCAHRRELAVEVVLADEHDRQAAHLREVQALVEVAPGWWRRRRRTRPRRCRCALRGSAAPVAAPIDAPTMPKQPTRPCSRSMTFIEPARPPQTPVARPSSSATSALGVGARRPARGRGRGRCRRPSRPAPAPRRRRPRPPPGPAYRCVVPCTSPRRNSRWISSSNRRISSIRP